MWGMKNFFLFAAAMALVSVCQAASDAATSAREAAQQYGATVRNCDMRWAVDSMQSREQLLKPRVTHFPQSPHHQK